MSVKTVASCYISLKNKRLSTVIHYKFDWMSHFQRRYMHTCNFTSVTFFMNAPICDAWFVNVNKILTEPM